MKKNFWGIIFLFTCLFGILIGCSNNESDANKETEGSTEDVEGGELVIGFGAQPPNLDPIATTSNDTGVIMRHVFESLVTLDSDYNVQPMLAESYEESDDGKEITFTLREGIKFHNGDEMTADDVVASMDHWKDNSGIGEDYFEDASFEKEDDYTVVLKMSEPLSTALTVMSVEAGNMAAIMPKDIIEDADSETGVEEFIGTGPFEFEEWKQDKEILLSKNEEYESREEEANGLSGKREPLVDELNFTFAEDPATQLSGLKSGEYDVIDALPRDNADEVEMDPNLDLYTTSGSTVNIIHNKKKGLFENVEAREAVTVGLNMEEILTGAYSSDDFYDLSNNIATPDQEGRWDSEIGEDIYNTNDKEKAKDLLEEAGYKGEEVTLITTRDYNTFYDASVIIQEQLEEIGMDVELEVYDWSTLVDVRDNEDEWDLLVLNSSKKPEPTANAFLRKDWAGWTEDEELDKIIKDFRSASSVDETGPEYEELQEWFWDYLPVTLVGHNRSASAANSNVDNYENIQGPILWNVTKSE